MSERSNRRRVVLIVLGAVIAVGATAAAAIPRLSSDGDGNRPRIDAYRRAAVSQRLQGEENRRSFEQPKGAVRWTLTRAGGPDGVCLDLAGEAIGRPDRGAAGSCGATTKNGEFTWAVGGVEVGGQWFNVAYGEVLRGAAEIRVTLGDGSQRSDREFRQAGRMWVLVVPAADPMDSDADISSIAAVDDSGAELARETPPSLVEARRAASASAP